MFLRVSNVKKNYQLGEIKVEAIKGMTFDIKEGDFVVILGSSGAGKTTLLNLLGGMDTVSEGTITLNNNNISAYTNKQLNDYRRNDIGFVFQFYNLIQNLTVLENVEMATQIVDEPLDAQETLKMVGLENRITHFPSQLSGGEQQRVAIARAIAKNPKLLLCDEPTGALDYQTGKKILALLQKICQENNKTVIIITHNAALSAIGNQVIKVQDGIISEMYYNENPLPIDEVEW